MGLGAANWQRRLSHGGPSVRQLTMSAFKKVEDVAMSLTEVLPEVQSLSRLGKIRLIQLLAKSLEQDDAGLIEPGRSYPVWSPDQAFPAAAALLQALEKDKGQP